MSRKSGGTDFDRALDGPAFEVVPIACSAAAKVLRGLRLAEKAVASQRSLAAEMLYRTARAAICHQINWDFLDERLSLAFGSMPLDAISLSRVTARDVNAWLAGYKKPHRIRAKERAALLRDLGERLLDDCAGDVLVLFKRSARRLYGPGGYLEQLGRFIAFSEDPLQKKSNVLIHEIVRDGLFTFDDEGAIAPAVDYHIMRLYLRTGRVAPIHRSTLESLKQDSMPRARLVRLLREVVSEAVSLTAFYADLSVPTVNDLEWRLGREVCDRVRPRCSHLPADARMRLGVAGQQCPNAGFCLAFRDPDWRSLREPDHKKSFY